jgi:short-subunit dehydrogenase
LAGAGAAVGLVGRDVVRLNEVAEEISGSRGEVLALPLDIRDADAIGDAVRRVESELGDVSVLINNAALQAFAPVPDLSVDLFRESLEVNLVAPYAFVRQVLPGMRRLGQGFIVNVSSDLGYRPLAGAAAYAASKRGLVALSEVLELELREHGIHVTCVMPGATASGWDGVSSADPSKAGQLQPDDLAEAVLWCVTRPPHARVDTLVIHPMVQSSF